MKKIIYVLIVLLINFTAFARVFDFSSNGDIEAQKILKNIVEQKTNKHCYYNSAYFYDIDNDSIDEIIGYAKSQQFYEIRGYNLILLKKIDDIWQIMDSDIYFDPDYPVEINDDRIIYNESVFYKNKKREAKYKDNKFDSGFDYQGFTGRQAKDIENVTIFTKNPNPNKIDIEDFGKVPQRGVNFGYKNLNEKTKHYLEMK